MSQNRLRFANGCSGGSSIADEADARLIDQLYRSHAASLRRFVGARVRSDTDADDVTHEVFVRVCRRGDIASLKSPAAVLFTTAFRLALNLMRRRRTSPIDGGADLSELELDGGERTPEESLAIKQEMDRLAIAFGELPPQCRRVMSLRVLDGLSYEEMSNRLGLSVSTLEKHVGKARRRLRSEDQDAGGGGRLTGKRPVSS